MNKPISPYIYPGVIEVKDHIKLSVELISNVVAECYGVALSDMQSQRRLREFAEPRKIAMYLSYKHKCATLAAIGKHFGGRDHATVMHAVRVAPNLIEYDKRTSAIYNEILTKLCLI